MTPVLELARALARRKRFRSLKTRITLWYGAIIALCLLAFSAGIGISLTSHARVELDRDVHEDIELAAQALFVSPQGRPSWPEGFLGKEIDEEEGGGHWYEVWSTGGERLLATGTLRAVALGPPRRVAGPSSEVATLLLPEGPVRVMTQAVRVGGRELLVRAIVSEVGVFRQLHRLWLELGALSLGVLALGGLGGYLLAQRTLGPLSRMAEHARRITAEQLHERLAFKDTSTELDQLRDAFNNTLARLEQSFAQLRRFTADASHELRTPLTALRSVGEVGLRGALTPEDYREVIGTMLEEVDRLSRLTDQLLALARADAGQAQLRSEPVDLSALAREVADQISVLAEERGQALETRAEGSVVVQGDRLALRQALLNLVDNAIKYAPEGTCVSLRVGCANGGAFVEVRDEGPGIDAVHRERIFERFYRADTGRSREKGGTGLGLSLVKSTAEAHGGRVELETERGRGSTFRLVLPREAPQNRA